MIDSILKDTEIIHAVVMRPDVELRLYRSSNLNAAESALDDIVTAGDVEIEASLSALLGLPHNESLDVPVFLSAFREYLTQKATTEFYLVTEPQDPDRGRNLYFVYISPDRDDAMRQLERRCLTVAEYFATVESIEKCVEAAVSQVLAGNKMQGSLDLAQLYNVVQMFEESAVSNALDMTNFGQQAFESLKKRMAVCETELTTLVKTVRGSANRLLQLSVTE